MMNNIVITDSEQFEEVIRSLELSFQNIKDIFTNELINIEEINGTDVWTGNAQTAMYDQFSLLSNNFEPIEYSLEVYINFLKKTLEDYRRVDEEISKNIDLISGKLDVNS